MKKILLLLLSFIITCSLTIPIYVKAEEASRPVLRFSVPESYTNVADKVLQQALKNVGYDLAITTQVMTSATQMAQSGETDGIIARGAGAEKTYTNLVMVPTPIVTWSFDTFVRADKELSVKSWNDLAGLRVGTLYQKLYVENHLPKNTKSVTKKDNVVELYNALQNDEIDIAIVSELPTDDRLLPKNIKYLSTIDSAPAYAYMNKSKSDIVPALVAELQNMIKSGVTDDLLEDGKLNTTKDKFYLLNLTSLPYDSIRNTDFHRGLKSVVNGNIAEINTISLFSEFTMKDRIRKNNIANLLRSELLDITPDAIVVSDEEALNFVKDYYSVLFQKIPVIFCGIPNFNEEKIDGFQKYFFGVEEGLSVKDTVEQMLKMYPNTKNIFVINDDSQSGIDIKNEIQQKLSSFEPKLNYIFNVSTDKDQLLKEINNAGKDTLVLVGQHELGSDFYSASYPAFGLFSSYFGNGQVGGKFFDSYDEGKLVGKHLIDLFNTSQPQVITNTAQYNTWMFDYSTFAKKKVNKELLPNDAKIINEPVAPRKLLLSEILLFAGVFLTATVTVIYLLMFLRKLNVRNRELKETLNKLHTAEDMLQKDMEIAEARKRLETTLESAPIHLIVCTVEGECLRFNQKAEETFEIREGESILSLFQTLQDGENLIHKLHSESFMFGEILQLNIKSGDTHRFYTNIANTVVDKNSEMYVWLIDIEKSEEKKDLITTSQKDLLLVLNSFPIALAILDFNRKREFVNNEYIELFDFDSFDEAMNYDVSKLYPLYQQDGSLSIESAQNFSLGIQSDETISFPWQYVSKTNQSIESLTTARPIIFHGKLNNLLVFRDISEEKTKAELLHKLAEAEKNANELKNKFLITMSHEIRTPMNAILGLAEIELKKEHSREILDILRKINVSAKNLLTIIGDILDFTKIEAEELVIFEEETELEEVISNTLILTNQRIGSKNISLVLHMDKKLPNIILTDKTRLWQILKNILDNSAKYTEAGSIALDVALVESTTANKMISFTVTDTGFGMSEEQLSRVFIPFEQFHGNVVSASGTGLGMTITKQIIEHMNGTFEITSKVNEGTSIKIDIPFKVPKTIKTIHDTIKSLPLSARRILIVDDDPFTLELMKDLLESAGVTPVTATSGEEALVIYKQCLDEGHTFDVVILDYIMGGMSGIETAEKIKAISDHKAAKLLMVSAYTKQLIISEIEKAGYEDVIEKPFTPTNFIKRIVEAIDATVQFNSFDDIAFTNANVLVCEDNIINQEVASGILDFFGIVPDIANNGQEALEMLEKKNYDLVFMDILMPIMDGHAATKAIRASDKHFKDIPIIAMTANVMVDEIEKCISEGMNGHIGKPISFEKVFAKLGEYLSKFTTTKNKPVVNAKSTSENLKEIIGSGYAGALARFRGNEEKYFKLLRSFATTISNYLLPINDAMVPENANQNKVNVHTLKGVAGNLGLDVLQEKARAFEKVSESEKSACYEDLASYAFTMAEDILANLPEVGGNK